jgi:hypothetical protein
MTCCEKMSGVIISFLGVMEEGLNAMFEDIDIINIVSTARLPGSCKDDHLKTYSFCGALMTACLALGFRNRKTVNNGYQETFRLI